MVGAATGADVAEKCARCGTSMCEQTSNKQKRSFLVEKARTCFRSDVIPNSSTIYERHIRPREVLLTTARWHRMDNLFANPVFSAGFGLIGVGTALALGRQALIHAAILAKRQCVTSLEVTSRDKAYTWILYWLQHHQQREQQGLAQKSAGSQATRRASAWWRRNPQLGVQTLYRPRENGSAETSFQLLPGTGRHYLTYRNTLLYV